MKTVQEIRVRAMSIRWLIVAVTLGASFAPAGSAEAQHLRNRNRGYGGYGVYGGYGGYGGGGYGGGYGGTVYGSYLHGMADYTQAAGQYNVLTSQAAINYQQVYSMSLDNRLKKERTYFEMRRENASERAAMAAQRPHATPDQIVEFNRARIPDRLSPAQWDPSRGLFAWPQSLAADEFADDRGQIEALFAVRDADPHATGLGSENYRQIKQSVMMLTDHLHAEIRKMSPDEYILSSKFLKSLEYEARFALGAGMAAAE